MKNFQIIDRETGESYWISRSLAVVTVLLKTGKEGRCETLLQRRGPGCPDEVGKLCCSCGYLGWDETLKEAAIRELYEETGITVKPENVRDYKLVDDPNSDKRQNVTVRFIAFLDKTEIGQKESTDTESRGGERGEVSELIWMPLDEAVKLSDAEFAFGHRKLLEDVKRLLDK